MLNNLFFFFCYALLSVSGVQERHSTVNLALYDLSPLCASSHYTIKQTTAHCNMPVLVVYQTQCNESYVVNVNSLPLSYMLVCVFEVANHQYLWSPDITAVIVTYV